MVMSVASFFALALALAAFFGAAPFAAALALVGFNPSFFGPALNRWKVPLSLDGSPLDGSPLDGAGYAAIEACEG